MTSYAHAEVLAETDWVKANLGKPGVKLVEIDVDTKAYDAGHIPGAVGFNWQTQLQDTVRRDILGRDAFEKPSAARAFRQAIPWCFTATTTTGLPRTASGFSKSTGTKMSGS